MDTLKKVKRSPAFMYSVRQQNKFLYTIVYFCCFFFNWLQIKTASHTSLTAVRRERETSWKQSGLVLSAGGICHRCARVHLLSAGSPLCCSDSRGAACRGLLWVVRRSRPAEGECWVKWWRMMGCSGSDGFLKPGEMGGWRRWAALPDISDWRCSYDKWAVRITEHVGRVSADNSQDNTHTSDILRKMASQKMIFSFAFFFCS